jgi:hypothetical protein
MTIETTLISSLFGILAAIIAAFVSSALYARKTRADLQKEFANRANERKWETYSKFGKIISDVFIAAKNNRLDREMSKITQEMMSVVGSLWIVGSDKVIDAYTDWQSHSRRVTQGEESNDSHQNLVKLAQIVVEMRKDLGYRSDQAQAKDLISIYVPDINENST